MNKMIGSTFASGYGDFVSGYGNACDEVRWGLRQGTEVLRSGTDRTGMDPIPYLESKMAGGSVKLTVPGSKDPAFDAVML